MKRHPSRCFMNNNKITNKRDRARLSQKQAPSLKIPFRHLVSNESEKQQTLRIKSRIIVLNCPSFTYPSNSKSTVSDSILLVTHTHKKKQCRLGQARGFTGHPERTKKFINKCQCTLNEMNCWNFFQSFFWSKLSTYSRQTVNAIWSRETLFGREEKDYGPLDSKSPHTPQETHVICHKRAPVYEESEKARKINPRALFSWMKMRCENSWRGIFWLCRILWAD